MKKYLMTLFLLALSPIQAQEQQESHTGTGLLSKETWDELDRIGSYRVSGDFFQWGAIGAASLGLGYGFYEYTPWWVKLGVGVTVVTFPVWFGPVADVVDAGIKIYEAIFGDLEKVA